MVRPVRHPRSGIYWYRRRVPDELVPVLGMTELKRSLRTKDPAQARIACARLTAEIEIQWDRLRQGHRRISHKEAVGIAGAFYRSLVAENEDDPGDRDALVVSLLQDQVAADDPDVTVVPFGDRDIVDRLRDHLKSETRSAVEELLHDHGIMVDADGLERVRHAVNGAQIQGKKVLIRYAEGDYRPDPDADRFPDWSPPSPGDMSPADPSRYDLLAIYDASAKEAGQSPATIKRWRPIITAVAAEVPDIRKLTPDWCLAWKDRLLASGLSNKSVQESYLASLRATCEWAVRNRRILSNPLDKIRVKVPKRQLTRAKGYTNAEARIVLSAALEPAPKAFTPEHRAARRWLPWLCAYSGARVGEMAQLRKQDVQSVEGVWLLWVTPEAGSTKNGHPRFVALHPHLIEQGFVKFVTAAKDGPLFYSNARRRGGTAANPIHKKVGERIATWVRSIGVADPQLQPNHGWRHRFKTTARKVGMDPGARDYMQGHVPHNEAEGYGEFEPDVLLREISKLPKFDVS